MIKMNETYIKSPLNYVGGKYKILDQIIPKFPKKINTFVDLFGGGFNVGINVDADTVVYNDVIEPLCELMNYFSNKNAEEVVQKLEDNISINGLDKENTDAFLKLRNKYNHSVYKNEDDKIIVYLLEQDYDYYYKNKHESRELLLDRFKEDKILFNSIDSNKIKIVLCHSPINISNKDVSNELENFNFIFCGHMHNGMMPYYLDKIIKGNRGLMSPDNRLFADNTRGVKDINNTHLIISGGITKLSKTSGIFRYFNFVYPMSIDNIVIKKGKIKKKVDIL